MWVCAVKYSLELWIQEYLMFAHTIKLVQGSIVDFVRGARSCHGLVKAPYSNRDKHAPDTIHIATSPLTFFVCSAKRYLSMYYGDVEVPKRASDGYENIPTLVGIADVFINKLGHVWNKKAREEQLCLCR